MFLQFEQNTARNRPTVSHNVITFAIYQKKTILKGVFRFFLSKVFTYFFVILVRSLNILRSPLQNLVHAHVSWVDGDECIMGENGENFIFSIHHFGIIENLRYKIFFFFTSPGKKIRN
jgi:hypothetical protein